MNKGSVSLGGFLAASPHGFRSRTSPGTVRFAADDAHARHVGQNTTPCVHGRYGRVVRQRDPERLGHTRQRWPARRSSRRPSARPAWSCRSRPAAPRRRSGCRGRLFDVDARQVARELRGRSQVRLAVAEDRELDRKTAGFEDAAFHVFGELAEVRVARCQLAPGVADADDRLALELVVRDALDIRCLPCSTPETASFSMTTNET